MSASIERQPPPAGAPPERDDEGDPRLVELIRAQIERDGPITFARFMELALYEPIRGYYATSGDRATRAGDFLTAPELHPIFGWTVARQIHEMWTRMEEPAQFVLREYGAGTGALGEQIRDGLARDDSPLARLLRYEPVEVPGRAGQIPSDEPVVGVVMGNEFLDALPIHRVINDGGRLRELYVGMREDRFIELMGPISDERIGARISADELTIGQRTEVSLAIPTWLREAHTQLQRGYVLVFDYGLARAALRSHNRPNGTVRAFRGHHVSSDVLGGAGHRDITAHVDLDALAEDAIQAGFDFLGQADQARFLVSCGLEEAYGAAREVADNEFESALLLRSAMRRLLDPRQLGGYHVIALGKGVATEPPLRGFS
jgi:SAM-dependent MidA family methyltransferase